MKKNVASQKIGAQLVSATDGSAFTGSVTVSVTGDAGTQATGSVGAGACTHEGNGYHTYAPAQAETNYDLVAFTFTGTGAVPTTVQVYTIPTTGLLAPTVADRTLDVSSGGEAGIDWANVGSPTTSVSLTNTTVATVTTTGTATNVTTVNGLAAGVITAASIATNAIDADALAADAVTEIQSGLATAANLATVAGYLDNEIGTLLTAATNIEADTQDIQSRLPAALVSGRMDSSTGAMAANVLTASALATDAVTEIVTGFLDAADAIETGITPRLAFRYIAAATAGKLSGAGTSTEVFDGVGVNTDRITATVDSSGNRTAITLG